MSKKLTLIAAAALASLTLAGCATQDKAPPAPDAEVMAKLATYAERASISMQRLASLRGANAGVRIELGKVPAGLELPVTLNWAGPVDQLAMKIAELTGYQFGGVLGSTKTPVLVSMAVINQPAFNVLADAGAQVGSAADIVVHPDTKKIFVKYAPVTRSGGYGEK